MKNIFCFFLMGFTSVAVAAEDKSVAVTDNAVETKTKITCFLNYEADEQMNGSDVKNVKYNHKTSESLRTTWKVGDAEYRSSEYKSYTPEGVAFSDGKSMGKFTKTVDGSKTTEITDSMTFRKFNKPFSGQSGAIEDRRILSTSIYEAISATERLLIKNVENGEEIPTRNTREITTNISDKNWTLDFIEATPYIEEFDQFRAVVKKSEVKCNFQIL